MGIKYPLEHGYYEVFWENHSSADEIATKLEFPIINGEGELLDFLDKKLDDFDILKGENPLKLLKGNIHKNRQVAIIDIEKEYTINELLDNGYTIREFYNGKCILQRRKRII